MADNQRVAAALKRLLTELIDRAASQGGFILNRGEAGLANYLRDLSLAEATTPPRPGGMPAAGHVRHATYALELLNQCVAGNPDVFKTADWEGNWRVELRTPEDWNTLVDSFESQGRAWIQAASEPREWDEMMLTGAIASVAHLAYHFGAIRQIVHNVRAM